MEVFEDLQNKEEQKSNENIIIFSNYNFNHETNLLKELAKYQRDIRFIPEDKRIQFTDLKRIVKFIPCSIFGNTCCIWKGYITNNHSLKKGKYVNFYFKNKKKALHRLLFINFKDDLKENEYIKYICENKGSCVSLNCMRKLQYKKKNTNKIEGSPGNNDTKSNASDNELEELRKNLDFQIIF